MSVNVLIFEQNPQTRTFLGRVVSESFSDALALTQVSDLASARQAILSSTADDESSTNPQRPFDILLIDLDMPDNAGLYLLDEFPACQGVKIVTSLYADDEHLFPALKLGVDGYLLKEERFEVVVETLQKIVRGKPPLSPALARRLLAHFQEEDPEDGGLSAVERDVLVHLSKGFSVKEVAGLLKLRWLAINDHIHAACKKLSESARAGERHR
jgi:DNA-binding NarL/FixJ family response regulator